MGVQNPNVKQMQWLLITKHSLQPKNGSVSFFEPCLGMQNQTFHTAFIWRGTTWYKNPICLEGPLLHHTLIFWNVFTFMQTVSFFQNVVAFNYVSVENNLATSGLALIAPPCDLNVTGVFPAHCQLPPLPVGAAARMKHLART